MREGADVSARYALYLAPPPDSELWRFGSRVLGRDAESGEDIFGFAPEGWAEDAWRIAADEPRRYGFHATLKAPFRLREGLSFETLASGVETLAGDVGAFELGRLEVSWLAASQGRGFVALTPAADAAGRARLTELEARAVRELDRFRAPLSEAERARRAPERLSTRQRDYLDTFGYPFVLEEFRLHFTLSGPVAQPAALAASLAVDFGRAVAATRFQVDSLALFVQPESGAPFRIVRRFPLRSEAVA